MTAAVRVDGLDVSQIAERCRRLITRGRKMDEKYIIFHVRLLPNKYSLIHPSIHSLIH